MTARIRDTIFDLIMLKTSDQAYLEKWRLRERRIVLRETIAWLREGIDPAISFRLTADSLCVVRYDGSVALKACVCNDY